VDWLIQHGVIFFGVGGAMGFDTLAAQVVLELREKYAEVKLILVLPCKNQTRGWPAEDIVIYEKIKDSADKVVYIADSYRKGCMHERDGQCVCYLTESQGGTAYTVAYARQKELLVWNLADNKCVRGEENVLQTV
jgi:uncharacterized phage-like protein YoqJ